MAKWRRAGRRSRDGFRLFFATDIHGSELCFRKWLNAARAYEADVLILGGDISGKTLVPVVRTTVGWRIEQRRGAIDVATEAELVRAKGRLRAGGDYYAELSQDEVGRLRADPVARGALVNDRIGESIREWVHLADERLGSAGIPSYAMLGNDDEPGLADILRTSKAMKYAEDRVMELPGGYEMVSFGFSTPTPWDTPRELCEDEISRELELRLGDLTNPDRAILNIHCPPKDTHLDQAPELDDDLRPVSEYGGHRLTSIGSRAVRDIILRWQPLVGLHGHVHESAGAERLGSTLCINPGSDYREGTLRGAIVDLDALGGIRRWQLTVG
jgi:uncharacterized protein